MITVLTPTYNRAYSLPVLFESLKRQTSMDFEWIVIDDGSTDNTQELLEIWKSQTLGFDLVTIHQENGGKHRAINAGIRKARGELTFIVDSDDYVTEDAIAFIISHEAEISDPKFSGLSGLRNMAFPDGSTTGLEESDSYIDATSLERKKLNLMADMAEAFKTEVLRSHPFPEFEGENFLWESCVWDKLAIEGYKMRFFFHVIYRGAYLSDGLTASASDAKMQANFEGFTYFTRQLLTVESLSERIFKTGDYIRIARAKGLGKKEICSRIGISGFFFCLVDLLFKVKEILKG